MLEPYVVDRREICRKAAQARHAQKGQNTMLDFAVILDRSGSMQERKSDHEGGLRSFIEDQRKLPGEMKFTLVQFDTADPCEVKFDRVPLASVDTSKIELIPRGGTPLYDAIGKSVAHLRQTLTPQDNVVVTIITDGEENASSEWTKRKVKALVDELEAANWKFLFLGASFEAFDEGESLGVQPGAAMMYAQASGQSVNASYGAISANARSLRSAIGASGQMTNSAKMAMNFTDAQRKAMNQTGDADTDADVAADAYLATFQAGVKTDEEKK